LVSNAIKFTPPGGSVNVKAKFIHKVFDFDDNIEEFGHLLENKKHGMLQVSV